MNLSIVIPNFNGEALLENNLPKVIDAVAFYCGVDKTNAEIIIVDDCSTDESIGRVKKFISENTNNKIDIRIVKNEKNLGFSSTVNKGVKAARGDIVVLLNTDVSPAIDFLNPLLKHFDGPLMFAVGCVDKSYEKGKIVLRGRGLGEWKKGFLIHRRGEPNSKNTLWVSGGSAAFRKSIWDTLGGLNELYNPFYWEDIDISYRALKSGYKIVFEPDSVVVHEHEKGSIKKKYNAMYIKIISYRNQFIFAWENATDIDLQLKHFLWLPYHLARSLINRDGAFFIGLLKAIVLFPKIVSSSFKAQKKFKKSDKQVIRELYE